MSKSKNPQTWERVVALFFAGSVIATFIIYIFYPPIRSNLTTASLVRFLASLVAGYSGYIFAGELGLEGRIPFGKAWIKATGGFAAFAMVLFLFYYGVPPIKEEDPRPSKPTVSIAPIDTSSSVSMGKRLLIKSLSSADKSKGIAYFNSEKFTEAVTSFSDSLKLMKNDPETLIYLNNAQAELAKQTKGTDILRIGTSVPIEGELGVAEGILRGIAQAQDEINSRGGVDGKLLEVWIANDKNSPQFAKELANTFQKNGILAVVGLYSSDLVKETAGAYDEKHIVIISPTATSVELSSKHPYFFRTPISDAIASRKLASHAKNNFRVSHVAAAYSRGSAYSESVKYEFERFFPQKTVYECDLKPEGFNPERSCISDAKKKGADAFLLVPKTSQIDQALTLIKTLNGSEKLLAGDSMYSDKTSKDFGQEAAKGNLTIAVSWHRRGCSSETKSDFETGACNLWGADIGWRTATAYDATEVIVEALDKIGSSPSSDKLRNKLLESGFSAQGATGKIEFEISGNLQGDRKDNQPIGVLVQVQCKNSVCDFVQINET
jgi:branched-chain amino acid transport system substrate-binding protein